MANAYGFMQGPPMGPGGPMQPGQMIGPLMPPPPPPPGPMTMDPASNNQPLQFNMNKGKPPMPMNMPPGEMSFDRPLRQRANSMDNDMDLEGHDGMNNGMMPSTSMAGGPGMMAQWGPMMGGPMNTMMAEPHMMGHDPMMMGGWGPGPMGPMPPANMALLGGLVDPTMPRAPIVLSNNTTLYPPPPSAPPPNTRERPPGCRTIFIGGLPENLTEEILREMCQKCGPITSVRISKKNFAHVRFDEEIAVEKALLVSGYRIKIENSDDKANTGRLHIDYAQARDDLYDWECQQRALAREMRHRQRIAQDRLRPPSPPPVIHYSDHEAQILLEKVKGDETFASASEVLITWMDRGDVNRRTSNIFYSMIQSVNTHMKRLTSEKQQYNIEYEEMKKSFLTKLEGILRQFELIEKVFTAAGKQKAWDHFSKAQRKNLDTWRRYVTELRNREQAEFFKERKEDEMEMSDEEEPSIKKKKPSIEDNEVRTLKEDNTNMKFQIEAYKNEVELLKCEAKELGSEEKDKQLRMYQQTMQGMQKQLLDAKQDLRDRERELKKKLEELEYTNEKLKKENQKIKTDTEANKKDRETITISDDNDKDVIPLPAINEVPTSSTSQFTDREARLVGLISTFLHVHPFGASVDYIWSYLQRLEIRIRTSEIEDLLEKCTSVFKLDVSGVGATIEKRWKFCAFNPY